MKDYKHYEKKSIGDLKRLHKKFVIHRKSFDTILHYNRKHRILVPESYINRLKERVTYLSNHEDYLYFKIWKVGKLKGLERNIGVECLIHNEAVRHNLEIDTITDEKAWKEITRHNKIWYELHESLKYFNIEK